MRGFALFAFFGLLLGCADQQHGRSGPGPDQIVRIADSEIKGLDPQKISDLSSLRVAADQFEGLTRLDAIGRAEPGLAESWSISENGLRWTFRLRENLQFSDGTVIEPSFFPELLDRLRLRDTASPNATLFDNIAEIIVQDDDQLEVVLKAPTPHLPALLAHPAMAALPLHHIKKHGARWTTVRPMITSGAYRLAEWRLNDHATLERNPHWHDVPAPTRTIIWKPMDDSLSAMRLFLSGDADITSDYPASRHQWLRQKYPDAARSVPYLGSYYFAFNTRQPPFDDVRVRRALSMTVEREWLTDTVIGIGNIPAWGLTPPGLTEAAPYKPEWADLPRARRLKDALKLLGEAGYNRTNPLKFEIRFNSSAEHRRVAVAMAAMWKPLHVEAKLFNSEAALHFAALRTNDFSLARSGWIADMPAPENFLMVHQTANKTGNYSGFDNAAYNALLDKALGAAEPLARDALMREAEILLMEEAPILPLYYYVTRSLVAPRLEGWRDNISNVHPSRTLRIRAQ